MQPETKSWRTKFESLQIVLRKRTERHFEISIGNGALTHIHPLRDCDFDEARRRAFTLARQFRQFNPVPSGQPDGPAVLEWEPVPGDA
jgi:hypothetical protein